MDETRSVTALLNAWGEGDRQAFDEAFLRLHEELHRVAMSAMATERRGHTLEPTALLHETYLRLVPIEASSWENRSRFLALASQVMRRFLVDYERRRAAEKRGGERVRLEIEAVSNLTTDPPAVEPLALQQALDRLAEVDSRAARIAELKIYVGATEAEIQRILRIARATVQRDWDAARRWLARELGPHPTDGGEIQ